MSFYEKNKPKINPKTQMGLVDHSVEAVYKSSEDMRKANPDSTIEIEVPKNQDMPKEEEE